MTLSPSLQAAALRAQGDLDRLAEAFLALAQDRRLPALSRRDVTPHARRDLAREGMRELLDYLARGDRRAYLAVLAERVASGQTPDPLQPEKPGPGYADVLQALTAQKLALVAWLGEQDYPSRTFAQLISELEDLYADIQNLYDSTYRSLQEDFQRVSAENALIRSLNRSLERHAAELARRNDELRVMAEINRSVAEAGSLPQLLATSIARLCELLDAKYGALWLWDEAARGLQIKAQFRMEALDLEAVNRSYRGRLDDTPVIKAFMGQQVLAIHNAQEDEVFAAFRHYAQQLDFRGTIYLPLVYQGKSTGILSLYFREPRDFANQEQQFLRSIASQLAIAIQLSAFVEDLQAARAHLEAQVQERTRELETEKTFLDRIVTHVPAAVAFADRQLVYQWTNPAYAHLVGVPASQLVHRPVFEVLEGSEAQIGPHLRDVLETGQPFHAQAFPLSYVVNGVARTTYWDLSYVPVANAGVLMLGTEVSERVARERLQQEKIAQLTLTDRMKDEFLSILSHELRTPLNAIMGFGSILEDELVGPLNEVQLTYLKRMLGGADALLGLINDLLDMSRIQAGKFTLEPHPFPLPRTLRGVIENLAPLAEQRGHRMRLDASEDLPLVLGDEQRVSQVLVNLVNNAIKFTPESGKIRVSARPEGPQVRVAVEDTGVGIAPEDLPKLFKPFSQVDMSDTRKAGGTGLGLSITKALVEAQGGHVGVESEPGKGSCFWFTLPIAKE